MDSVLHYLNLSNKYHKKNLEIIEQKAGQNSKLIYSLVEKEEELKRVSLLNKNKEAVLMQSRRGNVFLTALLLIAIAFGYYIYKTGRFKAKVNLVLKRQNKKLHKLDKERSEFFSIMTHELRTPLYTIVGLNKLIDKEQNQKLKNNYFKSLEVSSKHLLNLVNNVLQLTKFDLDTVKLKQENLQIDPLLREIASSFTYELERKEIQLHLINSDKIRPFIFTDKSKLAHVFINLLHYCINNVSKGNIWLIIKSIYKNDAKQITYDFKVKHDGKPVPEKLQNVIFKKFQATGSINEESHGLNLGLFIARRILNLYQSKVDFISNDGSTQFKFAITFKTFAPKTVTNEPVSAKTKSLMGHKILAVDDNRVNLMITKKTVENFDAKCDVVNNGTDAIELVKKNDYSLVLMDIHMPEVDGFESTRAIRKFNKTIPIIALTAVDLQEIKTKVFEYGMNQIVSKPFKTNDLYQEIALHLH